MFEAPSIAGNFDGRRRVIIEDVSPQIDGGRYPIKRTLGENVVVEADVFADGHDAISAVLRYKTEDDPNWSEVEMTALGNDRWRATFPIERIGRYRYTVEGWVDHFKTWQHDLEKKVAAQQDVGVDLLIGAELARAAAAKAGESDRAFI